MPKSIKVDNRKLKSSKKDRVYAGFLVRSSAFAIDLSIAVICGIIASIILEMLLEIAGISQIMPTVNKFIGTIVIWSYFIYLTYTYDATFGKKLVGIEVVSAREKELNLAQVIFRETVGKIISFVVLGIGFFAIGVSKKKQGFHDRIGKTFVVRKDSQFSKQQKIIHYSTIALIILILVIIFVGSISWLFRIGAARIEARNAYAQIIVYQIAAVAQECQKQGGDIIPPETETGGGKICSIDDNLFWPDLTNGFSYGEFSTDLFSLVSEDGIYFQCSPKDLQCNFE